MLKVAGNVDKNTHTRFLTSTPRPSMQQALESSVDQRDLNALCRRIDPLGFVKLMRRFTADDHTAEAQKAVQRMNLFKASMHKAGTNLPPDFLTFKGMPCVMDTGASTGLTPF